MVEAEEPRPLRVASVVESAGGHNLDDPRPRPGKDKVCQARAMGDDDHFGLAYQPGLFGERIVFHRMRFKPMGVQQLFELPLVGQGACRFFVG